MEKDKDKLTGKYIVQSSSQTEGSYPSSKIKLALLSFKGRGLVVVVGEGRGEGVCGG